MTVGQLITLLQTIESNRRIALAKDSEGNAYSWVAECAAARASEHERAPWSLRLLTDLDTGEFLDVDTPNFVPVIVFTPVW
jgi:hypothetical protein